MRASRAVAVFEALRRGLASPVDAATVARVVARRLALPAYARALSLPRLLAWLTPAATGAPSRGREGDGARAEVARVMAPVLVGESVARRLWPASDTCMPRALVRYAELSRAGLAPTFLLGVRPGGGVDGRGGRGGEGHAWVEVLGAPVNETRDPALVVTYRYPA